MKTLSLRQPWAHLVVHGQKRIENRRWNTAFRGPLLIHAAKGCTESEYKDVGDWLFAAFGLDHASELPELKDLQRGGIVGRARLVDVIHPDGYARQGQVNWLDREAAPKNVDFRWHMKEQFGFVLQDVEPLPFVPWPGALGLFDVPEDYATRTPPSAKEAWASRGGAR